MKTTASKNSETQNVSRSDKGRSSEAWSVQPPVYAVDFANIRLPELIQTKLKIGKPNDQYEREADAMADRIMRMREQVTNARPKNHASPNIQRKCAKCKEEEKEIAQKPLMLKSEGGAPIATSGLSAQLARSKGGGASLPPATNAFMSRAFGTDFSHVRIHTGNNAAEMNRQLNAKAFTHGQDIYFNQGRYNPASQEGKRLLAHELTHVNQQSGLRGYANKNISIQRKTKSCYDLYTADEKETTSCRRLTRSPSELNYSKSGHYIMEMRKEKCYLLANFEIGSSNFFINKIKTSQPLGKLISAIQKHIIPAKEGRIYLTGFTDCKGDGALNHRLRTNRTSFVQQALFNIDKDNLSSKIIQYNNISADQFLVKNVSPLMRSFNRSVLIYLDYKPKPKPTPIRLCCAINADIKFIKALKRAWSLSNLGPCTTHPDRTHWQMAAGTIGIHPTDALDIYEHIGCAHPTKRFTDMDNYIKYLISSDCTSNDKDPGVKEKDRKICKNIGATDRFGMPLAALNCPDQSPSRPICGSSHPFLSTERGPSGQVP